MFLQKESATALIILTQRSENGAMELCEEENHPRVQEFTNVEDYYGGYLHTGKLLKVEDVLLLQSFATRILF